MITSGCGWPACSVVAGGISAVGSVGCVVVGFPLAPLLPTDAVVDTGFGLQGQSVMKENEKMRGICLKQCKYLVLLTMGQKSTTTPPEFLVFGGRPTFFLGKRWCIILGVEGFLSWAPDRTFDAKHGLFQVSTLGDHICIVVFWMGRQLVAPSSKTMRLTASRCCQHYCQNWTGSG